jgi:hypothetical protein
MQNYMAKLPWVSSVTHFGKVFANFEHSLPLSLENNNEFVDNSGSSSLSLNLKENGLGDGLVDNIVDLCLLLLKISKRGVVLLEFVVSHWNGIPLFVSFVVDNFDLGDRFPCSLINMLQQPFQHEMVAETFLVCNPVFAIGL